MELGEKLRQARLEAGLSQQALCDGEITRNMLSLIEHGAARPSMRTLQHLASRLGKPVSWFLEESAVLSPNQDIMDAARRLFDSAEFDRAATVLEEYRTPDPVFDREKALLQALIQLSLAEQALLQGKTLYARELLEQWEYTGAYCAEALNRRHLLLLGQILGGKAVCDRLPSLDRELLLRAETALAQDDPPGCARLLDAVQDKTAPQWLLLRGEAFLAERAYERAILCFRQAEPSFPKAVAAKLEHCYRELGDYKMAYLYACRQRD